MTGCDFLETSTLRWTAAVAATAALAMTASTASAARGVSGAPYFHLQSHGGPVGANGAPLNPGIIVGFNPQPDPPGIPATGIDLRNPDAPILTNTAHGGEFSFVLALEGLGDARIDLPPAPNADGRTRFSQTIGGHLLQGDLAFGGAPVVPGSWGAFNPQPDPPGDVLAADLAFSGDPYASFRLTLDGQSLSFSSAPEPATWAMMLLGASGVGAVVRARRDRSKNASAA